MGTVMQNVCPSGRLTLATFSKFAFIYSTTSCALAHYLMPLLWHTSACGQPCMKASNLLSTRSERTTMAPGQRDNTKQRSQSSRLAITSMILILTNAFELQQLPQKRSGRDIQVLRSCLCNRGALNE